MPKYSLRSLMVVTALLLSSCQSEREKELEALWIEAIASDTTGAYLAFLAEQKHEEDREVGRHSLFDDSSHMRSREARGRMFALAVARAQGSCPYRSLAVSVDQSIRNVKGQFSVAASALGRSFSLLGVELKPGHDEADEQFRLVLNGEGIESIYYSLDGKGKGGRIIAGGKVQGTVSINSLSGDVLTYSGSYSGGGFVTPYQIEHKDSLFPNGLERALENAGLLSKVAKLVLATCGPASGALVYFGRAVGDTCSASEYTDEALEAQLMKESDSVRPIAIAAAFGTAGHGGCVDKSEKAVRFLHRIFYTYVDLAFTLMDSMDGPAQTRPPGITYAKEAR